MILEASYFGYDNFAVSFGDGNKVEILISFIPDSRFYFHIRKPKESANSFVGIISADYVTCIECPGEKYLTPDDVLVDSLETAFERVKGWVQRVKEEVIATNPFSKEIADLKKTLDERLDQFSDQLADFFSQAEADELAQKLDKFEQRLKEMAGQNEELKQTVEQLSQTIADLKDAANSVNRGTWWRMAGGRLLTGFKGLAKSKEVRDFALEVAKKIMLEGK